MDTRSEFRAIVGLSVPSDHVGLDPSEAIRSMWIQVADTYDVDALVPLWRYQIDMLHQYCVRIGRPMSVLHVWQRVMVSVCAFTRSPAPRVFPELQEHIDALDGSWNQIQDAIEALASAWEEIGL